MDIFWLESVDSTQTFLINGLKDNSLKAPILVGSTRQAFGKGSRGNSWIGEEGNLFISFAVPRNTLPNDLKVESSSIYFAMILKQLLKENGSSVWIKWPNDFYVNELKVGGVITTITSDNLVCGVGLNLCSAPLGFGILDISMDVQKLSKAYCDALEKFPTWKQIFSKFGLEFERSKNYFFHNNKNTVDLKNTILLDDGSLDYNGQRIFSLR